MPSKLKSSDISKLLNIVHTHQKDVGGGDPTDTSSAQQSGKPQAPNPILQKIFQAVKPYGEQLGDILGINAMKQGIKNKDFTTFSQGALTPLTVLASTMEGDPTVPKAVEDTAPIDTTVAQDVAKADLPAESVTQPHLIQDENGNFVPNPKPEARMASQENTKVDEVTSGTGGKTPFGPEKSQELIDARNKSNNPPESITKPPVVRTYQFDPNTNTVTNENGESQPISKEDILANQQRNVQLGHDVETPNQAAQVNATLNGYGIKGSATDQLQSVNDKIGELQNQAQGIVNKEGGTTPKKNLIAQITKDVSYGNTNIPSLEVQGSVQQYLNKVYTKVIGGDITRTTNMPDDIPDPILQKMKTIMNEDATSTFNQPDPSKWSYGQQISRYARNTLDNMLDTSHPNASALNNDMSDLYKSQESLTKGANAESSAAMKSANQSSINPVASFLKGTVSSPSHIAATGGILGVAGLTGYTASLSMSQPKNYNFSSGNITVPGLNDIKTNTGDSLQEDAANYSKNIQAINDREKQIALNVQFGIPSAVAEHNQLEQQRNTLNTKYSTVGPLFQQYQDTSKQIAGLDQAQKLIKNANPQWFQAFGAIGDQLTGIRAALVPGYAAFKQKLDDLHSMYGVDTTAILDAGSPQAADAAINQAVNSQITNLKTTVTSSGGQWPSSTGKDLIQKQVDKIISGPSTPTVAPTTPTPSQPTAAPTMDPFQQMLNTPFQPGVLQP